MSNKMLIFIPIAAAVLIYNRKKIADLIESFSSKWIGVEELGTNKAFGNHVFEQMMKNVGWHSTDQWCMYFAKAVYFEIFKKDRDIMQKLFSGNGNTAFDRVKKDTSGTFEAIENGKAQRGDIAIFYHANNRTTGHAAIVTKVNEDGTMNTIEGNTSDKSISDGDTVARKIRPAIIGKQIKGSDLVLRGFIRKTDK